LHAPRCAKIEQCLKRKSEHLFQAWNDLLGLNCTELIRGHNLSFLAEVARLGTHPSLNDGKQFEILKPEAARSGGLPPEGTLNIAHHPSRAVGVNTIETLVIQRDKAGMTIAAAKIHLRM
jgi:hypothetical protein